MGFLGLFNPYKWPSVPLVSVRSVDSKEPLKLLVIWDFLQEGFESTMENVSCGQAPKIAWDLDDFG